MFWRWRKERWLRLLVVLLAGVPEVAAGQGRVVIQEQGGVALWAELFLPKAPVGVGVVGLHGCAGPLPRRDEGWAERLARLGFVVVLPDSFGSRGVKGDCKDTVHSVSAYGARREDALAAAAWLEGQRFVAPGGVMLMGWSDGGTTVLAALGPGLPRGLIRGAVAFYPACALTARDAGWRNGAPLLILMGADDDWTPVAPCQALAARDSEVRIRLFAGAYHDFDVPDDPVHEVFGLPYTKNGDGVGHAGENAAAASAAESMVPAFFAGLPLMGGK